MKSSVRREVVAALAFALILASSSSIHAAPLPPLRRVNAPHFPGPNQIHYEQSAVFWFGQVNSTDNYADVRLSYDDTKLYVNVAIFDRWLWYNENPTSGDLTSWDAVSLYLDMGGNVDNAPGTNAYRFDGQLTSWENPRTAWQAAYHGNGTGWVQAAVPFTTTAGWRGTAPNSTGENRGWWLSYDILFTSLGLSGPPAEGALWGLGVVVHDRDNAAGVPPIPDKTWPEGMVLSQPATWGQLRFGLPIYTPPPAVPVGTITIRQGLNGSVVPDAAVGGTVNNMCPGDSNYIWSQWASFKDPHGMQFNVQNQQDVSDWPCFAKYFVTFPLDSLPSGKVILSATLTLHQFGNAGGPGWNPPPVPSYLQVLTIGQDWSEDTITWNTAPLARENIGGMWVDPLPGYGGDPGIPRTWDVSRAVAEAYAAGQPLRLAMYSADWAYHSGRYFWSSDHDDYHPEARPSVAVMLGEPAATLQNRVYPVAPSSGQSVTYTLSLLGSGHPLTLTDDLPAQVSDPGPVHVEGGGPPSYNAVMRRLSWTGLVPLGQPITLTIPVTVVAHGPLLVKNTAILIDTTGPVSSDTASFIVDARQVWLPLLLRR